MLKTASQKGISLLEVLIGMAMSAIIFMIAATIVVSLMSQTTKSKRIQDLEQAKNDIRVEFTNVIRWAEAISYSGGALEIDANKYRLDGEKLLKNGNPFTSRKVRIKSLSVTKKTTLTSSETVIEISIDMVHAENEDVKDTLKLVLSPRNKGAIQAID